MSNSKSYTDMKKILIILFMISAGLEMMAQQPPGPGWTPVRKKQFHMDSVRFLNDVYFFVPVRGITSSMVGAEPALGNPSVNGYVLSSTTGGIRSWVAMGEGGSMTYPGEGIALSTGSAWATSITNNSANWNTAYEWGDHAGLYRLISYVPAWSEVTSKPTTLTGYGITDAMSTSHPANAITTPNITNWNLAYGWGNHASAGYLTSQTSHTDVVIDGDFTSQGIILRGATAGSYSILTNNSTNWNSAYAWGNHGAMGYATLASPTFTGTITLPGTTSIGAINSSEIGYLDGVTSALQPQIAGKASTADLALKANINSPTFTGTVVLPSATSVGTVSATEIGYLDGLTAALTTIHSAFNASIATKEDALGNPSNNGYVLSSTTGGTRSWVSNQGGGMVYPAAGIALSSGTTWSGSITNNSSNWNTAYTWGNHATAGYLTSQTSHSDVVVDGDFTSEGLMKRGASGGSYSIITDNSTNWTTGYTERRQWDGGSTNLVPATGRTSLGASVVGSNLFTLTSPSAIAFLRVNADNSVSTLSAANFKTALSLTATDVGLANVTNESKATMFTSPTFTGTPTVPGYVPTSTTVNGHALTGNVTVTATDLSLGNVTNESKATMFTSPTFTTAATLPASTTIGSVSSTEIGYLDNVTSDIQAQFADKAPIASPTFTGVLITPAVKIGGTAKVQLDSITSNGSNIKFYHGATMLTAIPGTGEATWGAITGSITNQIDLTNAINLKANLASPIFSGLIKVNADTAATQAYSRTHGGTADTMHLSDRINLKANIASPTFTGNPVVPGYVPTTRTVNGHYLSSNVSVTASDVGLGKFTSVTASAAELNVLDGIPAGLTSTELGYVDGAESNLQEQLDNTTTYETENLSADIFEVTHLPLSTGTVVAGTGITAAMLSPVMYFNTAAAIDITADPQIADGYDGQEILIVGSSDTNTLTLEDGTGIQLEAAASMVLGVGDNIRLIYITVLDLWLQVSRSNN